MADVFIDCEWVEPKSLDILGAYSFGQDRFQLFNETLTHNRFFSFLDACSEQDDHSKPLLFVHGPDIGKIEKCFDMDVRNRFHCINTVTAIRRFTDIGSAKLTEIERHFEVPRQNELSYYQIVSYWRSEDPENQRKVLDYNWEDCINLWRVVKKLEDQYEVTRDDFINEARLK